jgi:hypothetical protein
LIVCGYKIVKHGLYFPLFDVMNLEFIPLFPPWGDMGNR